VCWAPQPGGRAGVWCYTPWRACARPRSRCAPFLCVLCPTRVRFRPRVGVLASAARAVFSPASVATRPLSRSELGAPASCARAGRGAGASGGVRQRTRWACGQRHHKAASSRTCPLAAAHLLGGDGAFASSASEPPAPFFWGGGAPGCCCAGRQQGSDAHASVTKPENGRVWRHTCTRHHSSPRGVTARAQPCGRCAREPWCARPSPHRATRRCPQLCKSQRARARTPQVRTLGRKRASCVVQCPCTHACQSRRRHTQCLTATTMGRPGVRRCVSAAPRGDGARRAQNEGRVQRVRSACNEAHTVDRRLDGSVDRHGCTDARGCGAG
jgi:hypothetical protein